MKPSGDSNYHETYRTLIVGACISGLYFSPVEKIIRRKWILFALKCIPVVPLFTLSFYTFSQLKFTLFDEGTLMDKLYSASASIFSGLTSFVVYSYHLKRKKYVYLFERMEILVTDDLFPEDRWVLIRKMSKFTNKSYVILILTAALVVTFYTTMILLKDEKDLGHPMGFSYKNQSPNFELAFALEITMGTFAFFTLISYDALTMMFVSLELVQYVHLKRSLGRILGGLSVSVCGSVIVDFGTNPKCDSSPSVENFEEAVKEAETKIRVWMKHHQNILRYHDEVQRTYAPTFAVKHITFTMILCLIPFLAATVGMDLKDVIGSIFYIAINYISHYINIKISDSITEQARSLFDEAFSKSWNLYPKRIKSTFLIIIANTNQIVQYVCLKIYPLNSRHLIKVISAAYSLFTFLIKITGKEMEVKI